MSACTLAVRIPGPLRTMGIAPSPLLNLDSLKAVEVEPHANSVDHGLPGAGFDLRLAQRVGLQASEDYEEAPTWVLPT
jgi:hypothetical protein